MENSSRRVTLLIVDDEPLNIELLAHMLGLEFEILVATNGDDALDKATRFLPDLILLDVAMPGLDGYEVCRLLKGAESTRDIPVIFITVMEGENFEKKALELGAADFIVKPMNPALVRLRVNNNVKTKLYRDQLRLSREHYRALVEDQTDLISRILADGTFSYVNEAYCRFFGKPREELLSRKWQSVTVAEDIPMIEERLKGLSPDNPVVIIEHRVYSACGDICWIQFSNRGLFDEEGRLKEIQVVGRDITELKRKEEEIHKLNEELEQRVNERTRELKQKIYELEQMNKVFVGREMKMVELKKRVRKLEEKHGTDR